MSVVSGVVLLVDDMPQSLGALAIELEANGYTVLHAHSGEAALQRLDLVTPDAILLAAHVRNARAMRTAREALDLGGHGVLVLDSHARVAWHSPQAKRCLDEFFVGAATDARARWLAALEGLSEEGRSIAADGRTIVARRLGESMWLLSVTTAGATAPSRVAAASLTARETEVLSWVGDRQDQSRRRRHPRHEPAYRQQAPLSCVRDARRRDPLRRGSARQRRTRQRVRAGRSGAASTRASFPVKRVGPARDKFARGIDRRT